MCVAPSFLKHTEAIHSILTLLDPHGHPYAYGYRVTFFSLYIPSQVPEVGKPSVQFRTKLVGSTGIETENSDGLRTTKLGSLSHQNTIFPPAVDLLHPVFLKLSPACGGPFTALIPQTFAQKALIPQTF